MIIVNPNAEWLSLSFAYSARRILHSHLSHIPSTIMEYRKAQPRFIRRLIHNPKQHSLFSPKLPSESSSGYHEHHSPSSPKLLSESCIDGHGLQCTHGPVMTRRHTRNVLVRWLCIVLFIRLQYSASSIHHFHPSCFRKVASIVMNSNVRTALP